MLLNRPMTTSKSMYLVLIEDHRLLAESVRNLLVREIEGAEVKIYHTGTAFIEETHHLCPDVIITDLMLPGGVNGIDVLDFCKEKFAGKAKLLVLSTMNNVQVVRYTIRSGVNGFLSKGAPVVELVDAIKTVMGGNQYISKDLRDGLINTIFSEDQVIYHLSPREKKVLQRVCNGYTVKEIASELNISTHTVQYYHRNVLAKFNVRKTSELIVFVMQKGLFIPEIK